MTTVGFAAFGIGRTHADSHLMFSGHWALKSFHETLIQVYAAKKRAEAAPGVGKQTDMLIIGPGLGVNEKISEEHIAKLEEIYHRIHTASVKQ